MVTTQDILAGLATQEEADMVAEILGMVDIADAIQDITGDTNNALSEKSWSIFEQRQQFKVC